MVESFGMKVGGMEEITYREANIYLSLLLSRTRKQLSCLRCGT
jgi:hypothetical protein